MSFDVLPVTKRRHPSRVLLAALAFMLTPASSGPVLAQQAGAGAARGEITVIQGASAYDGEGGVARDAVLVLSGPSILAFGPSGIIIPPDAKVVDGRGMWITPGIIDAHSHLGIDPTPGVAGHLDLNEMSSPVTADAWAGYGIWPQDPGFSRALVNGGVTTLQILPGSSNVIPGRSIVVKNNGATTVGGMQFPGATGALKLVCGENPKRTYGARNQAPWTRMGNMALLRRAFHKASQTPHRRGNRRGERPEVELAPLADVLAGSLRVDVHCYRADEMAHIIDLADEFGFAISTFHHAAEAYKIADRLKQREICTAVWADWWGFKIEAYDMIQENAAALEQAGACTIIHSDDPTGIQHLNQEVAKILGDARRAGINIRPEAAWRWLSINPARALGIADRTGSLAAGKMADVVLWNGDPLSAYSRPQMVWVDGELRYDAQPGGVRPRSDFELGQPEGGLQ